MQSMYAENKNQLSKLVELVFLIRTFNYTNESCKKKSRKQMLKQRN